MNADRKNWCPICLRRLRWWSTTGFGNSRRCFYHGELLVADAASQEAD